MGRSQDRIWIMCDRVDDRIQHRVDDRICERARFIFAIEQRAVSLWGRYCGWIRHVMLERIVDIEIECRHDRQSCRLGGGRGRSADEGVVSCERCLT